MAISNPFRRLKAETSTVDDLSAELGRLDRAKRDAEQRLQDLGDRRPSILIDGTDATLAAHDAEMAKARAAIEQAEARIAVIEPEWRAADEAAQDRQQVADRQARYAAAVKARDRPQDPGRVRGRRPRPRRQAAAPRRGERHHLGRERRPARRPRPPPVSRAVQRPPR